MTNIVIITLYWFSSWDYSCDDGQTCMRQHTVTYLLANVFTSPWPPFGSDRPPRG